MSRRSIVTAFVFLVGGSGWVYSQTQGTIPKYGASGTLVNSTIVEGTAGRIGIGIANPGTDLHLSGAGDNYIMVTSADVANKRSVTIGTNNGGNAAYVQVSQDGSLISKSWQMGVFVNDRFYV